VAYCFVIQPFDGGKFDKRYNDVFKPAIEGAGLEPYRVDRDPSVNIPINEIETGIRGASVCFADIALDNPNVWFELGYSLASEKEICLICSEERQTKFPFDVQHRSIIKYNVDSPSDYQSLREQITSRLKAIEEKNLKLPVLSTSPLKEAAGLSRHEMMVLMAIVENRDGPGQSVSHWKIKNDLDRLGYNNVALNIGIEKLIRNEMIGVNRETDQDGDPYNVYAIWDNRMNWLLDNSDRLELLNPKTIRKPATGPSWDAPKGGDLDDEIPF
jgi:hypothetical protein